MARDLIHLLRALFLPAAAGRERCWQPPADVYRAGRGWLIKLDLAGVRPEDLTVKLNGRRLTVRGQRRDWCVAEGYSHQRLEITYSRFERSIDLPGDADSNAVATEYRDGMLLVTIRNKEAQP
jgi:HSP20 family protein